MMSPVPSLGQSHTDFNGNNIGVDANAGNSDDENEMNVNIKDKHGRSQSVRIPRGKIMSLNSTSSSSSSSSTRKKTSGSGSTRKGRKKLKLKRQQNSAPPTPSIMSIPSNHNLELIDTGNDSEDGDDGILCKVEREGSGPIVVDNKKKPKKMKRKRSNSWALDSGHNSPKKGLNNKGKTEGLNIVDYNPQMHYWE